LNGSSSFDPDGTIIHYDWIQVSGPAVVSITNNNTTEPTVSGLVVGSYVIRLMVTDNSGATNFDQVTITVNPGASKINQTPVALAGQDTTIYLPASQIVLNASGSYDPDGSITSYQWQEISGPNTAVASSLNSSLTDISNLEAGEYQFQVTVTDDQGASSSAMVKIIVEKGLGTGDQLTVFPNPAHAVIYSRISSSVNGSVKINVYDMNGKTVLTAQTEKSQDMFEQSLNVSSLATGMYSIQVSIANRKTMVAKFIKQ
jgi:hypothetical protein